MLEGVDDNGSVIDEFTKLEVFFKMSETDTFGICAAKTDVGTEVGAVVFILIEASPVISSGPSWPRNSLHRP
jgi:hypothetical protein